jgi:quercetin dioxygenase-like cupin family protein
MDGERSAGAFSFLELTIAPAPRGGAPLHIHHREDEVFYVLEGELVYQVADRKVSAPTGSAVYVPRDTVHGFSNPRASPVRALVVIVPAGFEGLFRELGTPTTTRTLPPAGVPTPDPGALAAAAKRYGTEVLGPPPSP